MLIVHYEPWSGTAVPDGKTEYFLKQEHTKAASQDEDHEIFVSSENVILALRVYIREQKINRNFVQVQYFGRIIPFDDNGRCETWPQGFCDTAGGLLERLFVS